MNPLSHWQLNIPGTIYSILIGLRKSRWHNHTKRLCDGDSTVWKLHYIYVDFGFLHQPLINFLNFPLGIEIKAWMNYNPRYSTTDHWIEWICFGQSGLQRKKKPNCHKYATFEARFFLSFQGQKHFFLKYPSVRTEKLQLLKLKKKL